MRVLFHQYGSIVEPDITEAFRQLGLEIIIDDMEIKNKSIDSQIRISTMAELMLTNKPDFVFTINFFPYISDVCEKLGVVYISLSVDCPVLEIFDISIRNRCNRVFLFDYSQYESVVNENPECIFYLPLATNTDRWDGELADVTNNQYLYDVSFVGSLYKEKSLLSNTGFNEHDRGFLDGVLAAGRRFTDLSVMKEVVNKDDTCVNILKKAAPSFFDRNTVKDPVIDTEKYVTLYNAFGFELSASDRITLLNLISKNADLHVFTRSEAKWLDSSIHVHDGVSTHHEMPRIFRQSKINLNPTMRSIETGLPQRIWDILGCGGLLLTNYQAEIPEYFEIGEDLLCYENNRDCVELIKYFLEHDDERTVIAQNGYNKVKNIHTYVIRIAQILNVVFSE